MPRPSTKTPQRMEIVRQGHASGASLREVARQVGVPHQTIVRWAQEIGLTFASSKGGPKRKPKSAEPKIEGPAPAPEAGELGPVALVRLRYEQVRSTVTANYDAMVRGDFPLTNWEKLVKLEQQLAVQLAELEPPPTPDPELDPGNIEAAERAATKLRLLIDQARAPRT